MANRSVFGVTLAGLQRTHHHLAGVEPRPRLQRQSSLYAKLIGIAAELLLQANRRLERALWMVLVRERGAEQRENPVAGGLHDVAVVTADGIDHQLEGWINNRTRLFRVEVLHQVHRALDIGKQRGNGLALAIGCSRSIRLLRCDLNSEAGLV